MAKQKRYRKTLCLIYILTLFLWNICSGASSAAEITDVVCGAKKHYVNHSSAVISTSKHLPAQNYLSVRDLHTSETLSYARNRSGKPLLRIARQTAANLFSNAFSVKQYALSELDCAHEILSHALCNIVIINYIHGQDGQK